MHDTRAAIENVKSLARTFQSVIDLAAALDGVASIEQAARMAEVRVTKARQELAVVNDERVAAQQAVDAAHAKATQVVSDAEHAARQAHDHAQMSTGAALANTEMACAKREAAAQAQIDAINAQMAEVNNALAAKQSELREIDTRITKAKDRMAKMLQA